jgi:tRNA (guanine-N7-)-methyltransferase
MTRDASNEKPQGEEPLHHRPVRSFVLRAGRLTEGQQRALTELWPRYGVEEGKGELDLASLFGNDLPVIMEIGFGNGEATWQMANNEPGRNFLGVEVHKPGVGHLLLKIEEYQIGNLRIACQDAVELLRKRIPDQALSGVRIYFPDPWPKKRHHKRRIVQRPFIDLLARKMNPGGILHLATDWEPYAEHMLEVMKASTDFENLSPDGGTGTKPEWRPETKYEKRGERLGHGVYDLVFRRLPEREMSE